MNTSMTVRRNVSLDAIAWEHVTQAQLLAVRDRHAMTCKRCAREARCGVSDRLGKVTNGAEMRAFFEGRA